MSVPGGAPVALCFVRPVGCPFGRLALAEMARRHASFARAGVGLVAVTPSARRLAARVDVPYPLVPDEDGALRRAWRVGRDPLGFLTLRGVTELGWSRVPRALRYGLGRFGGDPWTLPSAFRVSAEGVVEWAEWSCVLTSGPDLEALLTGRSAPPPSTRCRPPRTR